MSWKEQNAIKRIYNSYKRLKNGIYNEDIDALKTVSDALDTYKQKTIVDNALFAKLLAVQLRQNIEYYGSIEFALKKIDEDLKLPLELHIESIKKTLNHVEYSNYLKLIGINIEFICSKADQAKNDQIIKEKEKEIAKKFIKDWSYLQVEKSFYNSANDFIKNVENYT
jgi:hypothetical protein